MAKFEQPVPESQCQSRGQELRNELVRFQRELDSLRDERRSDVGALQQKINKVEREAGELRASMELNNQQAARIDAKLDRVIER